LRRFVTGMGRGRFEPAQGEATLSGVYLETDDRTGRATRMAMVRQGGSLEGAGPQPAAGTRPAAGAAS
jgi:hypothetical protein